MAWRFLGRPGRPWRNWSRNLSADPERVFYPKTLDDLIAIVQLARVEEKKIRVAGDSHSWSPLVPTNEYLVFTKELKYIDVDAEELRVTVGAGTTIAEFDAACRENGVVLPTNVVPGNFHITAVAASGCHGTGIHEQTVSDYVEAIEIVDSHGTLRKFSRGNGDDVFNAARLSLGMFGIIWRTTFRVVKAFNVHEVDDFDLTMESAIPRFENIVRGHQYAELAWWPFNRKMQFRSYDRTNDPPTISECRHCWLAFVQRMKLRLFRVIYAVMMLCRPLTPLLLRIMHRASSGSFDEVVPVEWAIHSQSGEKILRCTNAEVVFPIRGDFADVERAFRVVIAKTREYQGRGSYPFNRALVLRFVRGSSIPLSPAYGDHVFCCIEIMSAADTKDWVEFSTEVMQEWMQIRDARPHWAKEARQLPVSAMRDAYGEHLRRFVEIRDAFGVDPKNMFVNDYLEAVFR
jgi:L-gulono-1,4-lactone dehydrogenase